MNKHVKKLLNVPSINARAIIITAVIIIIDILTAILIDFWVSE